MGKTEPTENLENWTNRKFMCPVFPVSMEYQCQPLWKNWKMAAISLISIVQKNFKLPTPPKFGSLVFRVLTEMEYQCWPLWKNWKMAAISFNINRTEKFQITDPPKFGSLVFWVLTEMEYQHQPLWKNWKMAAISLISIIRKNFKLPTSPKFGSLVFWVLMEMEYQCQPLWKNWKMAAISLIYHMEKFQIIWKNGISNYWFPRKISPPKFGSPVFFSSENWRCKFSFFEFSIGLFFLITHPRFHFNIYAWLHLKHLCMDIYASLVYPLSHLCVVLHFLIFV